MIKKLPITLVAFAIALTAAAQPILQASDIGYQVGDSYTINAATYQSEGSAGANQTWDFSGVNSSTSAVISMLDVSSTASGSLFTGATVAIVSASGTYSYFDMSASTLSNYGLSYSGSNLVYSDIEVMYSLPLNYGNTHTDNFAANFASGGATWNRSGSVSSEVDGYGTLITPAGTFTDVVRVKVEETYQDEPVGIPQIQSYTSEVYHWYKAGVHYPLFINTQLTINGELQANVQYTDITIGIENPDEVAIGVYPNPASDVLNVRGSDLQNSTFEILDILGQVVKQGAITNSQIDVANLQNGIYTLRATIDSNKTGISRFQVAH